MIPGMHSKIGRRPKKKMLLIVNPQAMTVSNRLRNLVVYALQGRFDVEVVNTEAQNHATLIGLALRNYPYDIVVAFGGDGTVNEVVNALAGTDVPISVLPGGAANVACRTFGIPNDVVDATEHLLSVVDDWQPRRVDLGKVDGRRFVFSCGAGIDASVAERIASHPGMRSAVGHYYVGWAAVSAYYRRYLFNAVGLRVETSAGEQVDGVSAIIQNSMPFTYIAERPVHFCSGVAVDDGTLAVGVLTRAAQRDLPTLVARLLSRDRSAADHSQIAQLSRVTEARVSSNSDDAGTVRPFPVQVDGDYIGERTEMTIRLEPKALTVIA